MMKLGLLSAVLLVACTESGDLPVTETTAPIGACGEIETHVIGIHDAVGGEASVHIDRPGRHVVVVSAVEATHWSITTAPGAELVHVYAVGLHPQTVTAPASADVLTDSMDNDGTYACGYSWPYDGGECNTEQLFQLAGFRVHHDVTSFHGCASATAWRIGEDLATTSDCVDAAVEANAIISCHAAAEGEEPVIGCGGPENG